MPLSGISSSVTSFVLLAWTFSAMSRAIPNTWFYNIPTLYDRERTVVTTIKISIPPDRRTNVRPADDPEGTLVHVIRFSAAYFRSSIVVFKYS